VQVNDAGFRCQRQIQAEKPTGTFRILVFGDSFTAGDGVSNRDRYTDVLERFCQDGGLQFRLVGNRYRSAVFSVARNGAAAGTRSDCHRRAAR